MASRAFDLDPHPARDDAALRTVIEDAAMGRWEGARELLSSTGADWDRRIFRLQVLARGGVRLTFADTWAQAEPRSPHALALLANVLALRSMAGGRGRGLNEAMQEAWSMLIVIGAQLFCGMASVTANSRMIYAFSRDGALPFSKTWHKLHPGTRTPTNAVWLAAGGVFVLGLPYLFNTTAYAAVTSIATIGLYIAYVIPTLLRRRQGAAFHRGPWHLGRWSKPVGVLAVAWVALITVLFMLPQAAPVTLETFNYAPLAVGVVLAFAGIWWLVSARKWFLNPTHPKNVTPLAPLSTRLTP